MNNCEYYLFYLLTSSISANMNNIFMSNDRNCKNQNLTELIAQSVQGEARINKEPMKCA